MTDKGLWIIFYFQLKIYSKWPIFYILCSNHTAPLSLFLKLSPELHAFSPSTWNVPQPPQPAHTVTHLISNQNVMGIDWTCELSWPMGLLCLIPSAWTLPNSTPKQLQLSTLDFLCLSWKHRVDDAKKLCLSVIWESPPQAYISLLFDPLMLGSHPSFPSHPCTCFILMAVSSASSGPWLVLSFTMSKKPWLAHEAWINYDNNLCSGPILYEEVSLEKLTCCRSHS